MFNEQQIGGQFALVRETHFILCMAGAAIKGRTIVPTGTLMSCHITLGLIGAQRATIYSEVELVGRTAGLLCSEFGAYTSSVSHTDTSQIILATEQAPYTFSMRI